VALAVWAGTWLVADTIVGVALQQDPGPSQVAALDSAIRLNPLCQNYRGLAADAIVQEALVAQRSGAGAAVVDATMNRAISAYYAAAHADKGDVLIRVALASILVSYSAQHPGGDAASQAVAAAQEAAALAPRNAVVLVTLARAYKAAGRLSDAQQAARLAREVAPAYSMQTLSGLGLD